MKIAADLHIHSTLSPCASLEMSPAAIVARAKAAGLDLIAVTDHNSVENGFIAAGLGEKAGVKVLCGMEAQSREDVHLLCLFDDRLQAQRFHEHAYARLPDVANNADYFGDQVVVDEQDNIVRHEPKLLLNALDLSIAELLELVLRHDGALVPAHVEEAPYGLLFNLGLVPDELAGAVCEISCASRPERALAAYPGLAGHPLISNSDAHYLKDIGRAHTVYDAPSTALADLLAAARAGRQRIVYRRDDG